MSAWIEMIQDSDASPKLLQTLELARTPAGTVDNVMRVHSLRPHTMEGHVALYRAALHNENNTLPLWFLETIASYVSIINRCEYSLANHWSNAATLIGDSTRSDAVRTALDTLQPEKAFEGAELLMLSYAAKLTAHPGDMQRADVQVMQDAGVSDGEILEVNQVVGYFCYANRLLNGLGVSLAGDVIGYYEQRQPE